MSYLVLARKWRPQNFADIAGQEHITRTLQNAIRAQRIAHAFLFTGVRGVGKTTAARILAKALNCEKGPTPTPCNECSQCREITNGSAIDVLEIDGASNRGIDEIRQIIDNVRYQPANCRFKIYIIDEVHQVTKDAFNALLKTLEEPPPSVKFILATTEPHRLPETILSRCQRFDFRRIALREIVQQLGAIAKKEGLEITPGALVLLAREADGSMRDGQSLLEQVLGYAAPAGESAGGSVVDESLLQDILGLAERRLLYDLSGAVIQGDAKRCVEIVAEAAAQGRDLGRLSRDLVEHFRNLMVARLTGEKAAGGGLLLDLPDQEIADLSVQTQKLSLETLLDYFDFMASGDEAVARSANPRFALETTLIRLAALPQTLPVAALLDRLEKLEGRFSGAPRPPVAPPRETAAPAARHPVAPPAKPYSGVGEDRERVWQDFVAFVAKEKRFLASHLQPCALLEFASDRLKIGVAERLHMSYLEDAENLSALKNLAKQFFTADMAITLTSAVADAEAKTGDGARGSAGTPAEERSDMAKEVLRIFGGSIRNVRKETA